jgi:hypothetical protein
MVSFMATVFFLPFRAKTRDTLFSFFAAAFALLAPALSSRSDEEVTDPHHTQPHMWPAPL